MNDLSRFTAFAMSVSCAVFLASAEPVAPREPAHLAFSDAPTPVAAGAAAEVTLRLEPAAGVKINRYPKIKLEIPAQSGLVQAAAAEIGNDRPPAPDAMDKNYYEKVDPVVLKLAVAPDAAAVEHQVSGKLTYFYCVTASGFCAPARVPVTIPVAVR